MDRYQTVLGIVVNKRTIKEADLLVTLLTAHNGKIVTLAKGAKNIKSSRLGALQLGNTIKAHIYHKNGFNWLSEAETVTSFLGPTTTLTQINLLFYFLELLNALIAENQQIEKVFDISQKLINSIYTNQVIKYIGYEINFITTLGFGPPQEIMTAFEKGDYKTTQNLLRHFFESLTEKKFESTKLFQ